MQFLKEINNELKAITFPKGTTLKKALKSVLGVVFIYILIIGILDLIISSFTTIILK